MRQSQQQGQGHASGQDGTRAMPLTPGKPRVVYVLSPEDKFVERPGVRVNTGGLMELLRE